ncbi:YihY/virulence factor BrkB family protein [Nocardioides sp.]|uniref:YihY/virulence factor BrkB family protein n=1 Tax=Nocardioides sp. TaxID=35761 RepID=UPI0037845BD0
MASPKERLAAARERSPLLDHALRTQEHYGAVQAGQQAGGVTYYAFLSVFPILALGFFLVGLLVQVYPDAQGDFTDALNGVMPKLVGDNEGQIQVSDLESATGGGGILGLIGLLVLLYAGLGWISSIRRALMVVFEQPAGAQPSFLVGKARDLLVLALIGVVLLVAVVVAGLVGGFAGDVLEWLGISSDFGWLLTLLTVVVGFGADMLLFYLMFVLLTRPVAPRRSLWSGAVLGAVAFEILKQISNVLFRSTQGNPAFQAFGIALILLVWINYFSRVVLYSAAWSHTSAAARALRVPEPAAPVQGPPSPALVRPDDRGPAWVAPYAAGALSTLGLVAVARKLSRKDR